MKIIVALLVLIALVAFAVDPSTASRVRKTRSVKTGYTCGGVTCPPGDLCCSKNYIGSFRNQCYSPKTHHCIPDDFRPAQNCLCGKYDGCCNEVCFDAKFYTCDRHTGQLKPISQPPPQPSHPSCKKHCPEKSYPPPEPTYSEPTYPSPSPSYPEQSCPEESYPTQPSYPAESSYTTESSCPEESYPTQPSYPAESSHPVEPSYPVESSYPVEPSYPAESSYHAEPSCPEESYAPQPSYSKPSHSGTCGQFQCGSQDLCCSNNVIGFYTDQCYSPSTHHCIPDEYSPHKNCLCGKYDGCCNGVCFDAKHYICKGGSIVWKG